MSDTILLFSFGSLSITAYSLILAVAAGIGLLWMHFSARRVRLPADTAVRFGLWAVPLGLVGGRALFVAFHWSLVVDELGWQQLYQLWDGGFALFGVIPGCLLAGVCCARGLRRNTADVLDAAAPGAALILALARFAEYFTPQGIGLPVDATALQWFPLAIQDGYGEWVMPVFFWEGVAALAVAFIAARALRSARRKPLDAASVWLLGIGITQVLLESLRTDDLLRLGMVKVSQLAAMACVLAVGIRWAVLAGKAKASGRRIAAHCAGMLIGVSVCVAVEFALDKSAIPNTVLYLVMALTLSGIAALVIVLKRVCAAKATGQG